MFYTISQNNSGGYYIKNDMVDEMLCVEANSKREAASKLGEIVEDHSAMCMCCGERWCTDEEWLKGYSLPTNYYGQELCEMKEDCIIHYLDGTKKRWLSKSKELVEVK